MEPEKVAPEAISAPIQKMSYGQLEDMFYATQRELIEARRGLDACNLSIASLEQQLKAMTEDRDLWQDEHNDDCPNKTRADAAEQQLAALKASHVELMGNVSFICVLAETAPRDGAYFVLRLLPRTVQKYNEAFARAREVQK